MLYFTSSIDFYNCRFLIKVHDIYTLKLFSYHCTAILSFYEYVITRMLDSSEWAVIIGFCYSFTDR